MNWRRIKKTETRKKRNKKNRIEMNEIVHENIHWRNEKASFIRFAIAGPLLPYDVFVPIRALRVAYLHFAEIVPNKYLTQKVRSNEWKKTGTKNGQRQRRAIWQSGDTVAATSIRLIVF